MNINFRKLKFIGLLAVFILSSCADLSHKPEIVPESLQSDDFVTMNYEQRTWIPADEMTFDPIGVGVNFKIPVNQFN